MVTATSHWELGPLSSTLFLQRVTLENNFIDDIIQIKIKTNTNENEKKYKYKYDHIGNWVRPPPLYSLDV